MISSVKGTQDFLDMSVYNFIINQMREHLTLYHFSEISTPILEPVDLFHRTLGTYTDVVSKEMFLIIPAPGSKELICLRPEATASTMRAFFENHVSVTPWKVFSYGPMFRYERPQKGRYRQFHQINIESIAISSIAYDAQFIAMLDRFFADRLTLTNYALLINTLGCAQDRITYQAVLKEFLSSPAAVGICDTCLIRKDTNMLRVFDCKNSVCREIYKNAPVTANHLCQACSDEWQQLQELLLLLSVSYKHDTTLVRGLDYYNKTVFEFVSSDASSSLGSQNAFCGGGRYELATQLGHSTPIPSFGAAMGIERLMLMLDPLRDRLAIEKLPALQVIMPLSPAQQSLALLIADMLQAHAFCVDVLLDGDSIKNMMRKANKMGAATALIVGQDEQEKRAITVKNMITGSQETIAQIDLVAFLQK